MNLHAARPGEAPAARTEDWRILAVLGPYRLLLVTTLLTLYRAGLAPAIFEQLRQPMFYYGCLAYALIALVLLLLGVYRTPSLRIQAHLHLGADVLMIGALVLGTGGVSSGLGILLIPPVVGSSLVLRPRLAAVHAAVATLAMLGAEAANQLAARAPDTGEYTQAGLLGLMFFVSSLVANAAAQRARRSEAVAARVGSEFMSLSRLSENVIEAMHTGVLVVDADGRIRTANTAARRLLGSELAPGTPTTKVAPELHGLVRAWHAANHDPATSLQITGSGREVSVRLTRLGWGERAPVLVMLEDTAQLREQAQRIKLAALGRLSAGIAHEIRNPLSAITQAGQLLAESTQMQGENGRLLAMIQRHAGRIERIVSDVLDLSRRDPSRQQTLSLRQWLAQAVAFYHESHPRESRPIELTDVPAGLRIRFDPEHLRQVLFNLWDNSFESGARSDRAVRVSLRAAPTREGDAVQIDVADDGPGIPGELQERIFEPFFTTNANGTGLGLFLCRELCEYNQARLSHVPTARGAMFRIRCAVPPAASSGAAT
ncbi:ATP-binding protein [Fontimonas sp. SYSU GA230001]|uniref:sensor histidine kinase n=1 Tax=Fontimonas sp. SYSU GA230001 TaxID=3142450 RepID=UPI0032B50C04